MRARYPLVNAVAVTRPLAKALTISLIGVFSSFSMVGASALAAAARRGEHVSGSLKSRLPFNS
jgi:hypothetical protein